MNPRKDASVGEIQSLQRLIIAFFMLGLVDIWCYFVLGSITDASMGSCCEALHFRNLAEMGERENGQKQIKVLKGTSFMTKILLGGPVSLHK